MADKLVEVENLSFTYTTDQSMILNNINISINQGDYIALIGQNGSGKTTLVKLISGLLKPTSGQVFIKGEPVSSMSVNTRTSMVGYCYQNPDHQIFLSTIEDEIAFGPKNLDLADEVVRKRVDEALSAVGLSKFRKEEPYFAGKGDRQKVAVASILAMRPRLIILDEPTTGLDWKGSQDMMNLIAKLWQSGHTIVIITHNMRLVAEHARRVVVMCQGEVIMDDTPAEVFRYPDQLAKSYLKPPQITQLWHAIYRKNEPWLTAREAQIELKESLKLSAR